MQRGIVIDIQNEHLVVITADGLFKKIPKQSSNIQIGDEVTFQLVQTPRRVNWRVYLSGAVAAVLALFFLFPILLNNEAHANTHIYVEIEPGIEIGINDELEVVRVRPLDQRAKGMVKELNWDEKPVKQVVVDYLEQAKNKGYIKKKDKIVLSAINEKGSSTSTLKSIQQVIENDGKVGKNAMELKVLTFAMPKEIKPKAEKTGLTPGKYGVWLLSKKEGKEIPVKQLVDSPISDIADDIKLLEHPPTESEWKKIASEEDNPQTTPDDSSEQTKTEPSTDPSSENEKQPTTNPIELIDKPIMKERQEDVNPSDDKNKEEKSDKQTKDHNQEEDRPTSGSKGLQTNHGTP